MRIDEIIIESEISKDSWDRFRTLKSSAEYNGDRLVKTHKYQLFVPRGYRGKSGSQKRKELLANPYAWDDTGNLKSNYKDYEDKTHDDIHPSGKELEVEEAGPPILSPSRGGSKDDWIKPSALLWTSSARKHEDGSWSSDWTNTMMRNGNNDWIADYGYLYEIKPGAAIIEISGEEEAASIAYIMSKIGKHDSYDDTASNYDYYEATRNFPWEAIGRNFDGVYARGSLGDDLWARSWEVESIAWTSSSHLKLLGKVKVMRDYPDSGY